MGLGRSGSLGLEGYCSPSWLIELWQCVCPLCPSPWYLAVRVPSSCQELCYLSGSWGFLLLITVFLSCCALALQPMDFYTTSRLPALQ